MPHSAREKWVGAAWTCHLKLGRKGRSGQVNETRGFRSWRQEPQLLTSLTARELRLSLCNLLEVTHRIKWWNMWYSDLQSNNASFCISNRINNVSRLGIHFSKILCTMLKESPSFYNIYEDRVRCCQWSNGEFTWYFNISLYCRGSAVFFAAQMAAHGGGAGFGVLLSF